MAGPGGTWTKRGLLLDHPGPDGWVETHVALPSVDRDEDGATWMYYSGRDARGRAHICRAELTIVGDTLTAGPSEAVLEPGHLGTFDDSGVTHACVVDHYGTKFLYYTGWTLGQTVPFYLHTGLAISTDGGASFNRVSQAPVMERSQADPYLTASPSVLVSPDGTWHAWYVAGTGWRTDDVGQPMHRYHIRYATSADGITWRRHGQVAVDYASEDEYAFGRPCVVRRKGGGYDMWFCARGDEYQLHHAYSDDRITWTRSGTPQGLELSAEGWDSEMACYPWVFTSEGHQFLLYNGNGYGESGVGYAVRQEPF